MKNYSVEQGNPVMNEDDHHGWRYVEADTLAPYRGKSDKELKAQFESDKRVGMTLNEYIIAAQDSKLTTGVFFEADASSFARLPGSRHNANVVDVYFHSQLDPEKASYGALFVGFAIDPKGSGPHLGGRSSVEVTQENSFL